VRNPFRRKYSVRKYSLISGRRLEEQPPAPAERLFWTRFHADVTAARLNWGLRAIRYDDRAEFRTVLRSRVEMLG